LKIVSSNTKRTYFIDLKNSGREERYLCPECSESRKKKKDKCLAWDSGNEIGYCHHCQASFFIYKPHEGKGGYFVPEWKNKTDLTDKAVRYFEGRMIKQSVLRQMKIHSDTEYMPQFDKKIEVICFPYFRSGKLVNTKFRGAKKSFKMVKNAELIFWNIDSITESNEVIITEGEIDALCFIQAGFKYTISVPNGANIGSMDYLDSAIELIAGKEKVYIATDNDTKGIELRDELIRRISPEKCYLINFKDTKDANDYLLKYGAEFSNLIKDARPVPVKGIIETNNIYSDIKDYYINGIQRGDIIDFNEIDKFVSWETGRLAVVTGIPSHGKSELIDFIVTKLVLRHNWKAAYFTPENYPLKFHFAKIFEKIAGTKFNKSETQESIFDQVYEYINEKFFYILNDDDFTLKNIIESAKYLVKTKGVKILVIDPYNKVEYPTNSRLSETQYISKFLDELIVFTQIYNCLTFLVAHPRKMEVEGGNHKCPTLYDISGSAHFYNKTDYGFTVYRLRDVETGVLTNDVEVHWQKIKYKHLGEVGRSDLAYNYVNGRFEERTDKKYWNNKSWIDLTNPEPELLDPDEWITSKKDEIPF